MNFFIFGFHRFQAPRIRGPALSLAQMGNVVIVAPEENKSASSSSLTLKNPLTISEAEKNIYYIIIIKNMKFCF